MENPLGVRRSNNSKIRVKNRCGIIVFILGLVGIWDQLLELLDEG